MCCFKDLIVKILLITCKSKTITLTKIKTYQQTFISLFEKQFREITAMSPEESSTLLRRQTSYAGQHYKMEATTAEVIKYLFYYLDNTY